MLVAQASGGAITRYAQDLAAPLSQVLQVGATDYVYGADRIAALGGTSYTWYATDALGSVRGTLDASGDIHSLVSYDPWGQVERGTVPTFGFTGELQQGDQVYLRARWYNSRYGAFISNDHFFGFPRRPNSLHPYNYAYNNPILLVDHSGYSPVDCSTWPYPLQSWCNQANGADTDPNALDAREYIYLSMITAAAGVNTEGSRMAGKMLYHFLSGGGRMDISLSQDSSFANDQGIMRATRGYAPPLSTSNEADEIVPLLADFLVNIVEPIRRANPNGFQVGPKYLRGKDHYYENPANPKVFLHGVEQGTEPIAYDIGWWAAFGHVTIDGNMSAEGYCSGGSLLIKTRADYIIDGFYEWFSKKETTFPGGIRIPHDWAISLEKAGRAKSFPFTVKWTESIKYRYDSNTGEYYPASTWDQLFS